MLRDGVAAGGVLDLDHRCAERAEQLRRVRARERDRQVETVSPSSGRGVLAASGGISHGPEQARVGLSVAEHSERPASPGSTPTRAGASTSPSPSAGPRPPRPGCYRKLGLLAARKGDYPRRHVEADYLRVLRYDDEVEIQLRVGSVGRTSVTFTWDVVHDGQVAIRGRTPWCASTTRAGRSRSTTAPRAARVSRNLILSPGYGRLGSQRRLAAAPGRAGSGRGLAYAEARSRCPVARVDGVLGGFWAVLGHDELVQAALDYGAFSNVVPFFSTLRPPLECDPPEHTVYRRLLNPFFARERLAALEAPLRRYAARDARRRSSTPAPATSPRHSATRFRRARSACSSGSRTTTGA